MFMIARQPIITKVLNSVVLMRGSNQTFVCTAIASPPLTYGWRFDGNRFEQNVINHSILSNSTHSVLTLYNLQVNNEGMYSCLASNRYGTDSTSANITILCK